jgi:hypothetical protein
MCIPVYPSGLGFFLCTSLCKVQRCIVLTMEAVSISETSGQFLRDCTAQHPRKLSSSSCINICDPVAKPETRALTLHSRNPEPVLVNSYIPSVMGLRFCNSLFSLEIPDWASIFSDRLSGLHGPLLSLCPMALSSISMPKSSRNSRYEHVRRTSLSKSVKYLPYEDRKYTECVSSFLTGLVGKTVARRRREKGSYSLECDQNFS